MSILNVNKINPVGSGSTVTIAGIASVTNNISVGNSVTASSFHGNLTGDVTGSGANLTNLPAANLTGTLPAISGANLTGVLKNIVEDTSPQLGGNLDVNTKNIVFGDSGSASDDRLTFGAGTDLSMYHDGSHSRIVDSGTGNLILQTSKININNADGSQAIIHGTAGGSVEIYHANTNVVTTSANGLAFPNGKGIDFSATGGPAEGSGSSELFDDYEEGSFTPVWKFDPTNATGVTYNIQNGKYVKIGGVVFIRIELQVSNKGSLPSGAGWAQIDGLPYACSEYSAVSIGIYQHFNNVQPGIAHVGTSEQVYIAYDPSLSSNTSSYDLQHTNFTNNSRINISGTYYAV